MAIPADPNDGSFLSAIFITTDENAYERTKDIMERAGLPNAADGEYFSGPNVTRLYLREEGISFSVHHRNVNPLIALCSRIIPGLSMESARVFAGRTIKDHEILQPLYQEDFSRNCCFEIVPGIPRAKTNRETIVQKRRSLAKRNIHFSNPNEEFIGVLRKDGEEAHAISNRRSCYPLKSDKPCGDGDIAFQDKIYGGLNSEFTQAVQTGNGSDIQRVMKECRQIANLPDNDPNKILHSYWASMGFAMGSPRARMIAQASQKYSERRAGDYMLG